MADLTISLDAEMRGAALVLRYTVRNGLSQDVYLLNRVHSASPPMMTPDLAYVELDAAERLVRVYKGIPSQPPGLSSGPPVPAAPYVTPVRAGAAFSEIVHIPAPVRIYRAYGRTPPRLLPPEETITTFRGVSFDLGWYARAPGVTESPSTALGQPVILPTGYKTIPPIHVMRGPVVELAVPVILPPR